MRIFGLSIFCLVVLVSWNTFFPQNSKNFEVTAVIEIDGRRIEGRSVWQVTLGHTMGSLGGPSVIPTSSAGNAVAFDLGNGDAVFLRTASSMILSCLPREPERAPASVRLLYVERCDVAKPRGQFTFVQAADAADGPTAFSQFGWSMGEQQLIGHDGGDPDEIAVSLAHRGFRLVRVLFDPTSRGFGPSLADRYRWIAALPRYDDGFGNSSRWHDKMYANYFTTLVGWNGRNIP